MLSRYFIMLLGFISLSFSQEYNMKLVLDKNSQNYFEQIKKEVNTLFPSVDKITYETIVCDIDCDKYMTVHNAVILLNQSKKYTKKTNNSILTYNLIDSIYDENKVVRRTALAIYETIKENRRKSFYIENKRLHSAKIKEKDTIKDKNVLDLKQVFSLAIQNNLDVKLNKNSIKLNDLDINTAKSFYKPQVDIYSNYIQIDKDRAQYSNGQRSQGTLESGVKVSQLIFSNQVLKNIEIKKLLLKSTKDEVKAVNDEIIYKATLIYLNIIKAKKANQIRQIKRDFIGQNLEFAKQRVDIGVQDRSDIYRWQSELANVNIGLANSKKELSSLKIELGNILQISNEFDVFEYGMNSELFKLDNKDAIEFIANKRVQKSFSNSIVHTHARLKQLNFLKDIKQEELAMNKESQYMPTLAFEGSAKKIINRYGEGSDMNRPWNNDEYQVVLNINIPLYEGGVKSTKIQKNRIELINLKLQYNNMKNLIVQNVRKNFESLKRSYEKIKYAKISQDSSRKNFELIQDKYKNGKENIISLLDAQDSYIISKLNLNISNIEYLSDLSSIYFFTGKIDILVDEQKKKEVEKSIVNMIKGL